MARLASISHTPSTSIRSVSRWMRRTVEAGAVLTAEQILSWAKGLDHAADRAAEIERSAEAGGTSIQERIDGAAAEAILNASMKRVETLAILAKDAATRDEVAAIDDAACFLVDAIEALALGVHRPTQTTETKGA